MNITKALADENRVRVILALREGELCVCQVVELLELAPSTVSKHMAVLRHAGLIEARKEGRWIYYRLADVEAPPEVRNALSFVGYSIGLGAQARQDGKRIQEICARDPEELCRQLANRENVDTAEPSRR